ncbi:MAG TPA: hydroxymethylglutaryl-CoA synthase family protein, partial [Proteobacteria bacterium]|nr:hydroxymethylglutaryl-CoA synthase family protein [Pseudomonadota bacterium]
MRRCGRRGGVQARGFDMAHILSCGVYIPYYRLKREEIAGAWRRGAARGERAVANYDEDSLTMGVEAGFFALDGVEEKPDALYFATTTPPYDEKQTAALAATVLDLPRSAFTADFTGSLRALTSALIAASHAVDSGRHRSVLVVASDMRPALPASPQELLFGDAACAFVVAPGDGSLALSDYHTVNDSTVVIWRKHGDRFVNVWEDRFVKQSGYLRVMREGISGLLKRAQIEPKDISMFAAYAPDARSLGGIAKAAGFDPRSQVADALLGMVGDCGVATAGLALISAVSRSSAGDRIVMCGFGDGCDALLFEAKDGVDSVLCGPRIQEQIDSRAYLSYVDYLRFRRLVPNQITDIPQGTSSAPWTMRDEDAVLK